MLSRFGRRLLLLAGLLGSCVASLAAPKPIAVLQLEHTALEVAIVADNFKEPIDLALGPDGYLWCTQLEGTVWHIDPATGAREQIARPGVFRVPLHAGPVQCHAYRCRHAALPLECRKGGRSRGESQR